MSKQQGIAPWLLIFLFGALVAASAVGSWQFIMHLDRQTTQSLEEPATPMSQASATRPLLPARPVPLSGAETVAGDSAPVTMADLTLKGVITRSDPSRSRALIAKGRAAEQAYSEGEEIQDNVTLEAIDSDHVVLLVNNRRETLYINRTLIGTAGPGQAALPTEEQEATQPRRDLLGNLLRPGTTQSPEQPLVEGVEGETEYLPTGQATDGVVSHDEAETEAEPTDADRDEANEELEAEEEDRDAQDEDW